MIDIENILKQENANDVIASLKEKTTTIPAWETLKVEYDPTLHKIMNDTQGRKDKIHADGTTDKAARLSIGLEKLLTTHMTDFTFAIPVKRVYSGTDTDEQKEIAKAIEKIYQVAHIDAENRKRGVSYYASCEAVTIWYVKKTDTPHNLYGFPCKYKLKCKTFSPMDDVKLYPLIDEFGEMYAMSYEYRKKVKDEWVTYFETFTENKHYRWQSSEGTDWEEVISGDDISINKIPCVYIYRPNPVWNGLVQLREDIEYTISRNSDVVAYNCAPILKVAGSIIGDEVKGETRRVYRVTEGGDVSYVSWAQSITALEYHVKTLLNLYFMQAQMPDISFENMRNLGNIGYDARKLVFTDAHMKIMEESWAWIEFLTRESNVIKAFLKEMNKGYKAEDIDSIMIEHTITPYVQEDESLNIDKWLKAGGGTALVSPLEAIKNAGLSEDPDATLQQILAFQMASQAAQAAAGEPSEGKPAEGAEASGGASSSEGDNE